MARRPETPETTEFTEAEARWSRLAFSLLVAVYIIVAGGYLIWRLSIAHLWHVWYAYPLVGMEIYSVAMTILFLVTTRRILHPVWKPPLKDRVVDVFIPTLNEPAEIIKMTTIGALHIEGVRNVYVLDDGKRPHIRRLARSLGAKYIARSENTHAKAGNMNHGLAFSDAEFLIFLDCDHVPQPNFVERLLGYFGDERLAFVQTPQTFYNADSIQFRQTGRRRLWNEQSMFYESIQPAKNAFNAAFFCGSGAMIRRAAIDDIGGFATGTATEDIHTSMRLHARGWRSLFVSERLAYGIAADDLHEYHKQRVRWGAGSLGLLFRSPDSPLRARGLTLMQRLCYFASTAAFLNGIQRLFYIALPALILLALPLHPVFVHVAVALYLELVLPFLGLSYAITYVFSRRTFHPWHTEQFNIINILANFVALKGIINVQKKFKVSSKVRTVQREASAYRLILILWAASLVADMVGLDYWFFRMEETVTDLTRSLVGVALLWNTLNLVVLTLLIVRLKRHDRQIKSPHPIPAGIQASWPWHDSALWVERLSLRGADLISPGPPPRRAFTLSLSIPEGTLALPAEIGTVQPLGADEYRLGIVFLQLDQQQERALTRLLFHSLVPAMYDRDVVTPPHRLPGINVPAWRTLAPERVLVEREVDVAQRH